MNYFHFRKWYFDLISYDANQTLYIYFIFSKTLGFSLSHVSINFHNKDLEHLKFSQSYLKEPVLSDENFSIEGNFFEQTGDHYKLAIQIKEIYLELDYHSLETKWSLNDSGSIIDKKGGKLFWIVPQPKASVEGKIIYRNKEILLKGYGYEDVVEMTIPFWKLPIKELFWGRIHCEDYTVIFNRLLLKNDKLIQSLYAAKNNNILYSGNLYNFKYDEKNSLTEIINAKLTLHLKHKSIIENAPVITMERIKSTFLNRFLSQISGNPLEKKMVSDVSLLIDEKIIKGYSIHERVKWGK